MNYLINRLHIWLSLRPHKALALVAAVIFTGFLSVRNPQALIDVGYTVAAVMFVAWILRTYAGQQYFLARLTMLSAVALGVSAIVWPEAAMAAGFSTWAKALKSQLGDIYDAGVYTSYGAGLFSTYVGISNGIKKSKGDQQIQPASIFGYGLGGPVLMMLGYAAQTGAETVGGGVGQMNKLP